MAIHPTAIVDPAARIHPDAEIGPFCIVGAEVEIGARTRLMANLYIEGPTWIGEDNVFYPYSTVGVASQDLKYRGERAETRIGHRNRIREFVTIHRGTEAGGLLTRLGDDNLIMAYAHIAHDCHVGDWVIMANAATLAGHVTVGDFAVIGALSAVHQFARVGKYAYIGGGSIVTQDVLPFSKTSAVRDVHAYGANSLGLQRRGFSPERVRQIQRAFRVLLASKLNTSQAIERLRSDGDLGEDVEGLIQFIRESERGVLK